MYRLFAVAAPGLEPLVQSELAGLGIETNESSSSDIPGEAKEDAGGIEFSASLTDLYRVNLHIRTANRILARLGEFYAVAFSELRKRASRLEWEQFIKPGRPVAIRVTCHKSRLYHSSGVAERIAGAIADRLGKPISQVKFEEESNKPPQLVIVRIVHDLCTISVDSSGARLHRRGYRQETAKAPLRETLAAAMLLASGWDRVSPLIDPFCGSGTIPIEAALLARNIAPGKNRHFAFMNWPNFSHDEWRDVYARAVAAEKSTCPAIFASDRDAGAIQITQSNAERAFVADSIQATCCAFSAIEPPKEKGWLVTNPPYGVRVSADKDLRNLYSQLGNVLIAHFSDWKVGFLCSSDFLAGHAHLSYEKTFSWINGGIPVKFYLSCLKNKEN